LDEMCDVWTALLYARTRRTTTRSNEPQYHDPQI
jgi:hypothetical protein